MLQRRLTRLLTALLGALFSVLFVLAVVYYVPDPGPGAPRVLVSVDRTTWNSIGLNRYTYVRQLRLAGLSPVLAPFAEDGQADASLLDGIDGLVLTGGGDVAANEYGGDPSVTLDVKPARDAFELELLELSELEGLPVLGLCRGAQLMNVYRGGSLGDFRDDEERYSLHRRVLGGHAVLLSPDGVLADIYSTTRLDDVTTWHGQHVETPGRGVQVNAYALDGIPEGFEITDSDIFMVGVQWHAEMPPWDRQQEALFDAFADSVRGRQR